MPLHKTTGLSLIAAVALAASANAAPPDATPKILDRWTIGGEGGWDYLTLDHSGARLFISHATQVDVLDTMAGKVTASIPGTNGVHGIALAEDLKRGYTSNGKSDSVTMFDLDTLKAIKEAPVPGHNPDAILYESIGKHVFTFNGRSKDVTVLDANTLAVVGTIAVPDKPEFAVTDGEGRIFANIESEAGQMVVIDARNLSVLATWALPGCASPSGLAIDKLHRRLFSVCDGNVMAVTDAATGKQVAQVKIGERPDAAAYDPQRSLVFSSNGDGTLSIIREATPDRFESAVSLPTQRGARTMALDPRSGRVYLVSADFDPAPPPTAAAPHPRPIPKPGTFTVLVVGTR
jgi:YVTN family beta-propeller protein